MTTLLTPLISPCITGLALLVRRIKINRIEGKPGFSAWNNSFKDSDLIYRIAKSYLSANVSDPSAGDSQWSFFLNEFNLNVHNNILARDTHRLQQLLRNPAENNLFYGFENIRIDYINQCKSDEAAAAFYAQQIADALLRFCETCGAIPLDNPENYAAKPPSRYESEDLLHRLDNLFGFEIEVPNPFPNEHGLHTQRGIIGYRTVQALFQAWRIKSCLVDPANSHVLEIGAGLGRTAYYASKIGIKNYTIVDLPFTAISSAYFLGLTLGVEHLHLHGESNNNQKISIITPTDFLVNQFTSDLVVNFDSFTEIDAKVATAYWNHIFTGSRCFLSINHEANNFRVRDFYYGQPGYQVFRTPCWARPGYIEELITPR